MAKISSARAIRAKSKSMYPTAGLKPGPLRASLELSKPRAFGGDDKEAERKLDGGYRHGSNKKTCPKCFVRFSRTGQCNC